MTVQAVACTVLHLCRVSHGQAPRNPPQGVLSCFQWSRDQNGPQDNQGAGPHSHRARHTAHVTPRRSRDQNGPQDNPGAGPRSHRAGTGTSAGQPFFCCRAASPVLGSVGLCGPSRDLCRGRSQVPPAAIWGCLRRPRAVMPPGWALAQEVGGMFCLGRALQHRLLWGERKRRPKAVIESSQDEGVPGGVGSGHALGTEAAGLLSGLWAGQAEAKAVIPAGTGKASRTSSKAGARMRPAPTAFPQRGETCSLAQISLNLCVCECALLPFYGIWIIYTLVLMHETTRLKEAERTVASGLSRAQFCERLGFPGGARGQEPACQCRRPNRHCFDPWVGKIPWRRPRQPSPVLLLGESHGQRSLADCSPWGSQRVRRDWSDWANTHAKAL